MAINLDESIPLLCLPFAGAGASFFRTWRRLELVGIDVQPVQLPGREERLDQTPYTGVATAVEGLLPSVLAVARRHPVALFGHSLGAVLAYELARAMVQRAEGRVIRLIVSGSPAPWNGQSERITGRSDKELLERVEQFAGYRHRALQMPELRNLLLPALRADLRMHEDYRHAHTDPLPVPIMSVRGRADHLVSSERARRWLAATAAHFDFAELPGGHMYLSDDPLSLLELISDTLSGDLARKRGALAR